MTCKKAITFLVGCLISISAYAQKKAVSGTVFDESGEALLGVNVVIKGTTQGVISDLNGRFSITVDDVVNDVLVFSFIGYETLERKVDNNTLMNVTLKSSTLQLDEVVAVGYGSMRKKDLTGSISSINVTEIEDMAVSNVAQAIAGRAAGVKITTSEGDPGGNISIRVRGGGSITQDNSPLYIIDGFPSEDGLNTLDPSDIESIDILKDASSTAIYGARGANGVIVVKTKEGTVTKTTINFDAYFGVKNLSKHLDVLNPLEFIELDYEREVEGKPFSGDGEPIEAYTTFINRYGEWDERYKNYENRPGIDWQDEAFGGNAFIQNYKVSISGGTKSAKYNFAYSHLDDEGLFVKSSFKRDNAKLKLNISPSEKFRASLNVNYTKQAKTGNGTSTGGEAFNRMSHIIMYRPTIGVKGNDRNLVNLDEDPALENDNGNVMQNPIVSAHAEHRSDQRNILTLNGALEYDMTANLTLKTLFGLRDENRRRESFDGARSITAKRNSIQGYLRNEEISTFSNTNLLIYKNKVEKHKMDFTIGNEQIFKERSWFQAGSSGFSNDDIGLGDLSQGTVPDIPKSYEDDETLISFFARAFYNYNEKYLTSLTLRADGSSKFGANHRWGYFPAISFAWRMGEEAFIKNLNIFSNLKLRLSYGQAGNNRIGNYNSLYTLSSVTYPVNNAPITGVKPDRISNPDLKWETTTTQNIGIEMGFIDQRIQLTTELYKNITSDLLLNSEIPYSTGQATIMRNIGETQNRGIEFILSTVNIKKRHFSWTSNFNISFNKNKINALDTEQDYFLANANWGTKQNDYIVAVGSPVGQIYGFQTEGLYQVADFDYVDSQHLLKEGIAQDPDNPARPGSWKYKNIKDTEKDGEGNLIQQISDEDRTVIGDANPIHFGGLSNTFSYKQFDLNIFLNWSYGNDVLNAGKLYYTLGDRDNKNTLGVVRERWSVIDNNGLEYASPEEMADANKAATVARVDDLSIGNLKVHSWGVEDASYLRISNVSVGYNIPRKALQKTGISKCRLYFSANNLYTFSNYSGYDPEVDSRNATGLTPGVDFGAYPHSRSYIVGLNLSL